MARLLVLDTTLVQAARDLGHAVETDPRWVHEVDAVLVRGDWEAVRGWRANNIRAGVVVFSQAPPPQDRASLEPVALLRRLEDLEKTLGQLFQGRPAADIALVTGRVRLDRALFEPRDGAQVPLSGLECRLLGYLGSRSGRAITRDELQLQVWDHRKPVPTRAVDMAVSRLRKKIEPDPTQPAALLTVRNGGYRLLVLPADAGVEETLVDTVGRVEAVDQIEQLLASGPVVITGPAGVGKTHLARVVSTGLGRCISVDLAGVSTLDAAAVLLATVVGQPAGKEEHADQVIARLYRRLAPATVTWDHVIDLPSVAPLVQRVPGLSVLLTCRTGCAGVQVYELPPLSTQHAVGLLVLRARQVGTQVRADGLEPLVRRLDQLPLALELAAIRVGALGGAGLLAVLEANAELLDPGRHRLRAAVDASLDRLSDRALASLADIAWLTAGVTPDEGLRLFGLGATSAWVELVDAAVLQRRGQRFVVLHAVRDAVFLRQTPDHRRLVRFLAQIAQDAEAHLHGRGALPAFERLAERLPDLLSTRDRAIDLGLTTEAIHLAVGVDQVLAVHASAAVRAEHLGLALDALGDLDAAGPLWMREGTRRIAKNRDEALAAFERVGTHDLDLYALARIEAARMSTWLLGPKAGRTLLEAIDLVGVQPWIRVLAHARHAGTDDGSADQLLEATLPILRSCMEELAADDRLEQAVYTGVELAVRLAGLGQAEAAVRVFEQIDVWAALLPNPVRRAQNSISHARLLAMLGRLDQAEQAVHRAELVLRDLEPGRVFQFMEVRAMLALFDGRHADARAGWRSVVEWATRQGGLAHIANCSLWLCDLEIDAKNFEAAEGAALAARAAADQTGSHHLRHHAMLDHLLVRTHTNGEVGALLDAIDPASLSSAGQDQLMLARAVIEGPDAAEWQELQERARRAAGVYGEQFRSVLDGERASLVALGAPPTDLNIRVLAALMLSTLKE